MKKYLAMLMSCFALNAAAQEFDSLQFMGDTCNMAETGYAGSNKKEVIYKGESPWNGSCSTVIPTEEFKKRYSSCAVSGFSHDAKNGRFECDFGYYDSEKSKVFFGRNIKTYCTFTCIKAQ